jgi:5-methylcytosine-specific restriction endonuclease McrA
MSEGKRRQGKAQASGCWIRTAKRAALYERDAWQCVYCGRGPRDRRNLRQAQVILSLDHLTPRSQGGSNEARNLVTACLSCNGSRGNREWREYATGGAIERIEWLIEQPLDIDLGKAIVASLEGDAVESAR